MLVNIQRSSSRNEQVVLNRETWYRREGGPLIKPAAPCRPYKQSHMPTDGSRAAASCSSAELFYTRCTYILYTNSNQWPLERKESSPIKKWRDGTPICVHTHAIKMSAAAAAATHRALYFLIVVVVVDLRLAIKVPHLWWRRDVWPAVEFSLHATIIFPFFFFLYF